MLPEVLMSNDVAVFILEAPVTPECLILADSDTRGLDGGEPESLGENSVESDGFVEVSFLLGVENLVIDFPSGFDDTRISGDVRFTLFNDGGFVLSLRGRVASCSSDGGQDLMSDPARELFSLGFVAPERQPV